MSESDLFDLAMESLIKSGRVKKTGTLKRTEPDEKGETKYVEDVIYTLVLS